MTFREDNCSTTSFNNSNIISEQIIRFKFCSEYSYIVYVVVASLILPFHVCALWYGRKTIHRGCKSSDVLSFNLVITSVLLYIPPVQLLFNFYLPKQFLYYFAIILSRTCILAQAQFHTWICVDHYVAVLHPIFYLKLKQSKYGLVLASFTWVISLFIGLLSTSLVNKNCVFLFLTFIGGSLFLIFLCSVLTLATLKQTVQVGGQKRDMHLKKLKAFKIITLTLVVLMISYNPYAFTCVLILFSSVPYKILCVAYIVSVCFLHFASVFHSRLYILRFIKLPCTY